MMIMMMMSDDDDVAFLGGYVTCTNFIPSSEQRKNVYITSNKTVT
jgi:hypothetical protein